MKITETKIKVSDLVENYSDDGDGGVYGYNNRLTIRPSYQRNFCFSDKQRAAVIDSVMNGFPLNLMYWSKTGPDSYEVLDGQQRTISIAQYVNKDYPVKINGSDKFFQNLTDEEKRTILDYELTVNICEGSEAEKLAWFKRINIAGVVLTAQELLNATYTGPWLTDAKNYFSKRNCVAAKMADGYLKGNPIRQELLEKALAWIADRDGLESGQMYMAIHQHDEDANDLWLYFQSVINWAKMLFPTKRKGITDAQAWGLLYNQYHSKQYNSNALEADIKKLVLDDDVTNNAGIIQFILSDRIWRDEKHLSLRAFTESQKLRAYERQGHKCPLCVANGINTEYAFEDMEGDHIIPWSKGGHTTDNNLQMLCKKCNAAKSDK